MPQCDRCGLFIHTTQCRTYSAVCTCSVLDHTGELCKNGWTAIEVSSGGRLVKAQGNLYCITCRSLSIPIGNGYCWGRYVVTYLQISALRIVRLASARGRRAHSPLSLWRVKEIWMTATDGVRRRSAMRPFPNYFGHPCNFFQHKTPQLICNFTKSRHR